MKRLMFIIIVCLISSSIYGQTTISKFRATHTCYQLKSNYTDRWLEFTDWESANILIVIDYTKLRIIIYSDTRQEFDIIKVYDRRTASNGDKTTEFRAVDKNGNYCGIRFVDKYPGNEMHLYIDYSDVRLAYNIKRMD